MVCFQATTGINGLIGTLGAISGGAGGIPGTYTNVPLTGGSGTGATANITVNITGVVSQVVIYYPGINYVVGDILSAVSANIGNVIGFQVPVASISINSSLAGGTVGMYQVGTLTYAQTWKNANQTTLNTNPIQLDQNGCSVMFGIGTYRQIVYDSLGNEVWDQPTSVAPINPYWAGTATGTANAIAVTDASFASVSGQTIEFIAAYTNTAAATLNSIAIEKNSNSGPVGLVGGEIVAGNLIIVTYDASLSAFIIQNPATPTSAAAAMLGGAYGTLITNNSSTPNTQINASATMAIMTNSAGFGVKVTSPSVTINAATIGANGIDAGGLAVNTWYYVWLINNGTTTAGLLSLSSTAPTLPTGYTNSLWMGSAKTDGSANLYRFVEKGNLFSWKVVTSTNTPNLFPITTGANGAPGTPTWVGFVVQAASGLSPLALVPPTAKAIDILIYNNNSSNAQVIVAPNSNYGGTGNATNPPPLQWASTVLGGLSRLIELETASIYIANQSSTTVYATGFVDSANVN